jgi:hypothetical protein
MVFFGINKSLQCLLLILSGNDNDPEKNVYEH